jgi:hypothetical protein
MREVAVIVGELLNRATALVGLFIGLMGLHYKDPMGVFGGILILVYCIYDTIKEAKVITEIRITGDKHDGR